MTPKGQKQDDQNEQLDDIGFLVMRKHAIERIMELQSNQYWQLEEELKQIEKKIQEKSEKRKGKQE